MREVRPKDAPSTGKVRPETSPTERMLAAGSRLSSMCWRAEAGRAKAGTAAAGAGEEKATSDKKED